MVPVRRGGRCQTNPPRPSGKQNAERQVRSLMFTSQITRRNDPSLQCPQIHHLRPQVFHSASAQERHVRLQLLTQNLNHSANTVLPISTRHAEEHRSADAHGVRTEAECFQDVCSASHAAIYEDLHFLAEDVWCEFADLVECEERWL